MNMSLARALAQSVHDTFRASQDHLTQVFRGRKLTISNNFYDQPYGSSKPNLKGKSFVITRVILVPDVSRIIFFQCDGIDKLVVDYQCEIEE